jgi:hypothetical protein
MTINRRGNIVMKDARTGKAADREMARMEAGKPEKGAVNRMPPSPKAVAEMYAHGKETISHREWHHVEHQENQSPEDAHDTGRGRYNNDCSGWVRGQGSINGGLHPHFDHGKLDPNNRPPKPARGLEANGRDMTRSPFSAANRVTHERED